MSRPVSAKLLLSPYPIRMIRIRDAFTFTGIHIFRYEKKACTPDKFSFHESAVDSQPIVKILIV